MGRWVLSLVLVSLVVESTNLVVAGSVEASSPEERHESDSSLSGLIPLTASVQATIPQDQIEKGVVGTGPVNPIITSGVFPYQPNPLAAIIAAGITMAAMTWKETGKIDLESLGYIFNSSDFYAGLIGSVTSSFTHKQTTAVIAAGLSRGIQGFPNTIKPFFEKESVKIFGNILNGFTYTFAISSGFEYFSQIWKHATKNIPEVNTIGGLVRAPGLRKKQVALNILYYMVNDTVMQKRILSSVFNHRIMTFEFIATNVGLYVGHVLTGLLVQKYGGGKSWMLKVAPVVGSMLGGLFVQLLPGSWKGRINQELAIYNRKRHEKNLEVALQELERGVKNKTYPVDELTKTGYFITGADLQSDIERTLRARDMVASFCLQEISNGGSSELLLTKFKTVLTHVDNRLKLLLIYVKEERGRSLHDQIEKWLEQNKTPDEIQHLGSQMTQSSTHERYYEFLLDAAVERSELTSSDAQGLAHFILANKPRVDDLAASFAVFGSSR